MNEKRAKEMVGMHVIGRHGRKIGVVHGVLVDVDSWKVEHLQVRLARGVLEELDMEVTLLRRPTVRISVDQVSGLSDTLVLDCALDDLNVEKEEVDDPMRMPPPLPDPVAIQP